MTAISNTRAWCAISAMFFLNGGLFGTWAARIPDFAQRFDLSPATLGLLLLCIAVGAILGFPISGRMTDARGARNTTLLFAWASLAVFLLLPLMPNVWLLGAALLLVGLTHGGEDVAMNAWASEVERHIGRAVMSGFHAVFSLGAGVGAAAGYLALRWDASVLVHFWIAVAIIAVVTMPFAHIPWVSRTTQTQSRGPLIALPKGALLLVGLVAFSSAIGEGAMVDWSALILTHAKQATAAQAALGYTVFSVAMVGTRLSGQWIVAALGPVGATRLSGISAGIGALIVMFAPGLTVALVGFVFFGLGYAMVIPLAFSRAANDPDVAPGQAIASVATLSYGAILIGPPLIGFVAEVVGLNGSLALLTVLAVVTASLASYLRPSSAQRP